MGFIGDLEQAQFGVVRFFADKLSVYGEPRAVFDLLAKLSELFGCFYERFFPSGYLILLFGQRQNFADGRTLWAIVTHG